MYICLGDKWCKLLATLNSLSGGGIPGGERMGGNSRGLYGLSQGMENESESPSRLISSNELLFVGSAFIFGSLLSLSMINVWPPLQRGA